MAKGLLQKYPLPLGANVYCTQLGTAVITYRFKVEEEIK